MKITKSGLREIIREEIQSIFGESSQEYNIGDKVKYLDYPAEIKGISDKRPLGGKKTYHIKYLKKGVGSVSVKFVNPTDLK
jgi:hypothetical protein